MPTEDDGTIEGALYNALEHVEDKEIEYWIRTALQRLEAKRALEDDPSDQ